MLEAIIVYFLVLVLGNTSIAGPTQIGTRGRRACLRAGNVVMALETQQTTEFYCINNRDLVEAATAGVPKKNGPDRCVRCE